jgi:hypothetical protein
MPEIGASGSVRGGAGNDPTYSAKPGDDEWGIRLSFKTHFLFQAS